MLKIITISCIILAVFFNFQKVNGFNLFPPIPIPRIIQYPTTSFPIPQIVPESSTSSPIVEGNDIQNNTSGFGIENILRGYLNRIQNANASCTKAYNEGRDTIIQLSSTFSSCLMQRSEILSPNANIKKLTDLAGDVRRGLTQDVNDALQCLQNPFSCLDIINRNLPGLNINGLIGVALSEVFTIFPFNLIRLLPHVIGCIENVAYQFNLQHYCELLADTGKCIQSVIQIFI